MSLTLLYRGKNVRFSMKLNKFHWISAVSAFALASGVIFHLMFTADEVPSQNNYALNQDFDQQDLVNSHADEQQLMALTLRLAELQSQVLRLNALGDRLASEANIPEKEFNFGELPPSGGPLSEVDDPQFLSLSDLLLSIGDLTEQINREEKQLQLLESVTLGHHIENSSYLSGRPISKGWLSSYFGMRKDPFSGRPAMHKGVDFAGKEDAAIIATASGVVSWAEPRYGYGNLIEIDHGAGLKTRYGHNKTLLVKVGDVVSKGQVIARMGSTGRSTGPHVHYEILRNGNQINPIKYVYRKAK
ncbi:M23 family metallopeptidase [Thalassomonas actiniarum]|uniref:M23 family metallopeptidase n=1 Tax=Thalassomonas actiniarum TaxID=485447 RepID=A0AAE9YQI9_9GAMM|nr:M23 family metallopeptidase [Thalassomonas actiniarum]